MSTFEDRPLFDPDQADAPTRTYGAAAELYRPKPAKATPPAAKSEAQTRRDAGAGLAENSVDTRWRLAAEHAITQLAASGAVFTSDDVHDRIGSPPGHRNAVGGVFIAASKRGEIRPVGYRNSRRPEAHARPVREWVGVR